MKSFQDKVAVVTGAASGIGLALAHRFAGAGMKVVLADIEAGPLEEAARAVGALGAKTLAVRTDVAQSAQVEELARRTIEAFGAVHVLCNNAGVAVSGPAWMQTEADWQWVLGVNLWGVIHGVRVFTPLLLSHGEEAHMVNTASVAGLTCAPGMSVYNVSKFGVVALSESLHHELAMMGSRVKVSVLCPGFVATRILDSARNRPESAADTMSPLPGSEEFEQMARLLVAGGQQPEHVAGVVLDAIRDERFWVLPNPAWKEPVRARLQALLDGRNPEMVGIDMLASPGAAKG